MLETNFTMVVTCDKCGFKEIFKGSGFEEVLEDFSNTKWIVDTPTGRRSHVGHFCSKICRDCHFADRQSGAINS